MQSEQDLVALAKQGSKEAFSQLVERFQGPLYSFLLARSTTAMDAEDRLQDAFLSAYRYINTYNPNWRFSTWLYRIALRSSGLGITANTEPTEVASGELGPLGQYIQDNDHDNLWPLAKRVLNKQQFDALWLRYVEDLSIKEIANVLDRNPTWVKVILFRARRTLATELQSEQWLEVKA